MEARRSQKENNKSNATREPPFFRKWPSGTKTRALSGSKITLDIPG
jgi:hypothetical protein